MEKSIAPMNIAPFTQSELRHYYRPRSKGNVFTGFVCSWRGVSRHALGQGCGDRVVCGQWVDGVHTPPETATDAVIHILLECILLAFAYFPTWNTMSLQSKAIITESISYIIQVVCYYNDITNFVAVKQLCRFWSRPSFLLSIACILARKAIDAFINWVATIDKW